MDIDGQETERFDIRLAPNPAATIEQEALDVAGVTLEQVQSYQPMEDRFLYDKEDDKKQRSTENRLFRKYACRDWDGRGSTQWKSFPTQSPICRGNDGLPFNVDNLTIPYGKWRKESIKAYGNAIVPLIAVKIFEMINKIEGYEQQTTL